MNLKCQWAFNLFVRIYLREKILKILKKKQLIQFIFKKTLLKNRIIENEI